MILSDTDPATQPSFSLKNRLARVLWSVAYNLLFRWSPRPLHAWRAMVLRCFGAHVGHGAHVYPGVRIWAPWNLHIARHAGIADGVTLYSMGRITIGERAVISQGAHLCAGTHDFNSHNFQLVARPITVGAKVWICAEAFVLPGADIPEGVVIGARSVVSAREMKPWTVYAGHPCIAIGERKMQVNDTGT